MGSEIQAAKQSIFTERAIFGKLMTGAYSNADLVANYEGHRFYRIPDDSALAARYRDIGIRDTRDMRVDVLCTSEDVFLQGYASAGD